jgi:hypothetical protein
MLNFNHINSLVCIHVVQIIATHLNLIKFDSCLLMHRINGQIANYTKSTTYRHKLTKDNKKDANETGKQRHKNKH